MVRPAVTQHVLREDWSRGIDTSVWRPFGEPRPDIVTDTRLGRALRNGGDGSFVSGVHRARQLPTGNGLAVDAVLSDSFMAYQWRMNSVRIVTHDSAALARWDRRSGYPEAIANGTDCRVTHPASESRPGNDSLQASGGGLFRAVAAPAGATRDERGHAPRAMSTGGSE